MKTSILVENDHESLTLLYQTGIHGAPKIPYQQDPAGPFNWNLGYCTHSSRLFTTWHRPYVALMEV